MNHPPILVIDDEPEIGRLVALALGAAGYAVEVFESGEDFLEAHGGQAQAHLLIVDKNLPGITGLEVVARHNAAAPGVFEAMMITGYADEASEQEAARLGIKAYVRKPFTLEELRLAVVAAEERLAPRIEAAGGSHP